MRSKIAIVLAVALSLLPSIASARCRLPDLANQGKIPGPIDEHDHHVVLLPGVISIFTQEPNQQGLTFSLKGEVCDKAGEPIGNVRVELIRYTGKTPLGEAPNEAHFESRVLTKVESQWLTTSQEGVLRVTGLAPGQWALRVDWNSVNVEEWIIFDLRRTWGFEERLGHELSAQLQTGD